MALLPVLLALLAACAPFGAAEDDARRSSIHTIITTECSPYFSWQSLGMYYSHRKSGQPGPITRVMCCTKEEYDRLPQADRELMPTHVAPSYTHHPRNGDVYSAYNKPVAVIDWLAKNDVKEEYVLVIDADMIMREPFTAEEAGAHPGLAVSAFFGYMKGVKNALAMKHVPEVVPRNDTLAGPYGRRGDMVGGYTLMHREDLRRVGPLWLKYTEDVRFDPDAWELSGDAYSTHKGDRPWISEMYGYSYGCAKADVWHKVHHTAMLYPGYEVAVPPKVLHYGLLWNVAGTDYSFDKHWHYDFNPLVCPPWDVGTNPRGSKKGMFAHPPSAKSFTTKGAQLLRDLLSIEVVLTLNVAFCDRHRKVCPPSDELERECGKAEALMKEYDEVFAAQELPDPCTDLDDRCKGWAEGGECQKNEGWMSENCRLACKLCTPRKAAPDIQHKEGEGVGAAKAGSGQQNQNQDQAVAADAVGSAVHTNEQRAQGANKPLRTTADKVADSAAKLRGGGVAGHKQANANAKTNTAAQDAVAKAKALRLRCTGHTEWSMDEVKDCLRLAAKGVAYSHTVAAAQRSKAAKAAAGGGNEASGEQVQRQEQQLHEDAEVLQAQGQGGEGGGEDAAAAGTGRQDQEQLLDEGRLLGAGARGSGGRRVTVRKIDTGADAAGDASVGLVRLGVFAVLLWSGTLVVAFFLLPWARKTMRRQQRGGMAGGFMGASPAGGKKGGRSD